MTTTSVDSQPVCNVMDRIDGRHGAHSNKAGKQARKPGRQTARAAQVEKRHSAVDTSTGMLTCSLSEVLRLVAMVHGGWRDAVGDDSPCQASRQAVLHSVVSQPDW